MDGNPEKTKSSRTGYNFDFLYAVCTFYLEHKQNSKAIEYARQLVEKYPDNQAGKQLLQAASQ